VPGAGTFILPGIKLPPLPATPSKPVVTPPKIAAPSGGDPAPARPLVPTSPVKGPPTPGPLLNPTQQNVAASGPIYNANGSPVMSSGGGAVVPPSGLVMATPDGSGGGATVTAAATFPVWGWAVLALVGLYVVSR
jgi:hypothetical protein